MANGTFAPTYDAATDPSMISHEERRNALGPLIDESNKLMNAELCKIEQETNIIFNGRELKLLCRYKMVCLMSVIQLSATIFMLVFPFAYSSCKWIDRPTTILTSCIAVGIILIAGSVEAIWQNGKTAYVIANRFLQCATIIHAFNTLLSGVVIVTVSQINTEDHTSFLTAYVLQMVSVFVAITSMYVKLYLQYLTAEGCALASEKNSFMLIQRVFQQLQGASPKT